jgi:cobalt-zinc-cadmium efflux system outer membrane protein
LYRNVFFIFIFIYSACFRILHAQSISSADKYVDPGGITVEELVQNALSKNAQLLAARKQISEAEGLLLQAGLSPNPLFNFGVTNGSLLNGPDEKAVSFGYTHIFELGGKRRRRTAVAEYDLQRARFQAADRERELRAEVREAFAEALAAAENLRSAEELFELNRKSFELAEERVKTGESAKLEQGLLEVELNRLKSDQIIFENQVARAILQLKSLAGIRPDAPLRLRGDLKPSVLNLSVDEATARGFNERPDLRAAQMELKSAEAEIASAKAAGIPDLEGSIGYSRQQSGFDQFGLDEAGNPVPLRQTDRTLSFGVSIPLPFRNRNQGNVLAAASRKEMARLELQFKEEIVRKEVVDAFSHYQAALQAVQIYEQSVIGPAQDNLKITRQAYELGELRLVDVINEQQRFIDTQKAYVDAQKELYIAFSELERAIGGQL